MLETRATKKRSGGPVKTTKVLLQLREFITRIEQHHNLNLRECSKLELIKAQWKTDQNHYIVFAVTRIHYQN